MSDASDATDTVDGADMSDGSTSMDTVDLTDVTDSADAIDVSDSADTTDAADGADAMTATDMVDSTDGTDGQDVPDVEVYGGVLITQVEDPNLQLGAVTAAFSLTPPEAPDIVSESGGCYAYQPQALGATGSGLSIGDITITGLSQPLMMSPNGGDNSYDSGLSDDHPSILGMGSEVTITAAGGADLNAVSATLAVPSAVSVTAPSNDVKQGQPLTVSWVTDAEQNLPIRIDIAIYDAEGEQKDGNLIACELENDSGSFTVSPALLAQLPVGGGFDLFAIDVLVVGVTRIQTEMVEISGPAGSGSAAFAITRSAGTGVLIE